MSGATVKVSVYSLLSKSVLFSASTGFLLKSGRAAGAAPLFNCKIYFDVVTLVS